MPFALRHDRRPPTNAIRLQGLHSKRGGSMRRDLWRLWPTVRIRWWLDTSVILDWLGTVGTPAAGATAIAKAVRTLVSVPPGTNQRAARESRLRAYSEFHREALRLCTAAGHLATLAKSNQVDRSRRGRTALSMVNPIILDHPMLSELRHVLRGVTPILRLAVAADLVGDAQHRHAIYSSIDGMLGSVASFGASLGQVRLVGRPGPQEQAEAVTVLLAELFDRATKPETDYQQCQSALGARLVKFLLEVRADLSHRWWHVGNKPRKYCIQIWRQKAPTAERWKIPDAEKLIAEEATTVIPPRTNVSNSELFPTWVRSRFASLGG